MRPNSDEDFERVKRFREWIELQCALRGINPKSVSGSEELADTYNNAKKADEPEMGDKAFRMWLQRQERTANVQRSSCYQWSLALQIPINQVLAVAGYMPEDMYRDQMSELPLLVQGQYGSLNEEEQAQVHDLIAELYCRRPR